MNRKSGFTLIELLIIMMILAILVAIVSSGVSNRESQRKEAAIISLFNGQELDLEDWMRDKGSSRLINQAAQDWCRYHNIPTDQTNAKVAELVAAFDNAVANLKIKLDLPLAIEIESKSNLVLPETTLPQP